MHALLPAVTLALLLAPAAARSATCPPLPPGSSGDVDHCAAVYRLVCDAPSGQRTLTGFRARVDGRSGLVTALHGTVGCERLHARNLTDRLDGLSLGAVDLDRDVALLTAGGISDDGVAPATAWPDVAVRVVGYPSAILGQYAHALTLDAITLRPLHRILAPDAQAAIARRRTPDLDTRFVSLAGALTPGYSGAPILTPSGEVLGIAIGGNRGGVAQVGFASPISDVRWTDPDDPGVDSRLDDLAALAATGLFADATVSTATEPPLPTLLLADARDREGRILRFEASAASPFYRWGQGTVYNLAWHPKAGLLFSDANDANLNILSLGQTATVFTHETYLRDVAVDPLREEIYFSEASGAGRDGTVYRLREGTATPYRRIALADVDGFWAGDFAFDPDGFLWLSSGNRAPASLYKVDGERTRRVFSSPSPISGFTFVDRHTILYTDWRQRLYRLSLEDLSVAEIGRFGTVDWLSDVTVLPSN